MPSALPPPDGLGTTGTTKLMPPGPAKASYNAGIQGDTVYFGNPNPNFVPQLKKTHSSKRNDPCPCGSGKKFKHCHWRKRRVT